VVLPGGSVTCAAGGGPSASALDQISVHNYCLCSRGNYAHSKDGHDTVPVKGGHFPLYFTCVSRHPQGAM
jgi:hypothetical protein